MLRIRHVCRRALLRSFSLSCPLFVLYSLNTSIFKWKTGGTIKIFYYHWPAKLPCFLIAEKHQWKNQGRSCRDKRINYESQQLAGVIWILLTGEKNNLMSSSITMTMGSCEGNQLIRNWQAKLNLCKLTNWNPKSDSNSWHAVLNLGNVGIH